MNERICGIDPGLANGGMILLSAYPHPEEVLGATRLVSKKGTSEPGEGGDPHFTDATRRAMLIAETACEQIKQWKPGLVVVESFVDLGSRAKKRNQKGEIQHNQLRWMTPLTIGLMHGLLHGMGYVTPHTLRYQNPAILSKFSSEILQITQANKAHRGRGPRPAQVVVPGDEMITNDHLLKAFCHASWARERWRPEP